MGNPTPKKLTIFANQLHAWGMSSNPPEGRFVKAEVRGEIGDQPVVRLMPATVEGDDVHLLVTGDGGGIEARLSVGFDGGEPTRVRLTVPGGLSASLLRRFAWDRYLTIADAARRNAVAAKDSGRRSQPVRGPLTMSDDTVVGPFTVPQIPKTFYVQSDPPVAQRPWGAKRPDEFYRSVANRYTELRASGERNPTAVIAREMGYNRNTVAGWVRKARTLRYLPAARPGRAG
jgi:hypothetical protein